MKIICGALWGLLNALFLVLVLKFYYPVLVQRCKTAENKNAANDTEEKIAEDDCGSAAEKKTKENITDTQNNESEINKQSESEKEPDKKKLNTGTEIEKNGVPERTLYYICGFFVIISLLCGCVSSAREDSCLSMIKMASVLCLLSGAAIIDLKLYIIPNLFVAVMVILRVLFIIPDMIYENETWLYELIGCVFAGVICLLMLLISSKITHGGIGYGDVKLISALGLCLGIRASLYTLLFALLICSCVSIVLLVLKKKNMKDGLPLGPFVWIGFAATVVLGII